MKRTALIRISVPEDAEDPIILIQDALERYCGTTYPIYTADHAQEIRQDGGSLDGAIVLEEETI